MSRKPADDWADSRWMPPSPHREAVLEKLAAGRAHIEEQGHGKPPLFVYEDGGVIELPRVRVGGRDMIAAEDEPAALPEATRHVDVCGTIDELEAWVKERPDCLERDAAQMAELLAQALRMCQSMERRWIAYERFAGQVAELAEKLRRISGPPTDQLDEHAEAAVGLAREGAAAGAEGRRQIMAHLEAVRNVANRLEQTLRRYRDAATQLAALYEDIRGARDWSQDVDERLKVIRGEVDDGQGE